MVNSHNCASIYFQVTFSLPLPSSLLKLPNDWTLKILFKVLFPDALSKLFFEVKDIQQKTPVCALTTRRNGT